MRNLLTVVMCIVATLVFGGLPDANAYVSDDFSDLNDTANPTWTHLDGLVASTGQTWDASTGQYRMTAPNNGFSTLGFVGSYVAQSFSDVVVSADIVSFVDGPGGVGVGGPFAVGARLDGNNVFNSLKGYAYAYEPQSDGGNGEFAIYRIIGASLGDLAPAGVEGVDYIRKVTLDPNKDYTLTLSVQGTTLQAVAREVGGPIVAYQTATDATYASGFSGIFGFSQNPIPPTDITWDNFRSQVPEPAMGLLIVLGGMGMTLLGGRCRGARKV
jgi:hypothetical protein